MALKHTFSPWSKQALFFNYVIIPKPVYWRKFEFGNETGNRYGCKWMYYITIQHHAHIYNQCIKITNVCFFCLVFDQIKAWFNSRM